MSLILHVLSNSTDHPATDPAISYEFKLQGGSIGRSQNNDWVLADPQKYLSGQHARIEYRDDGYILTDTSTNGVFYNRSTQAMGKGGSINLKDGDVLRMGIYEINVSIANPSINPYDNASDSDPFTELSDVFSKDNAAVKDASIDVDDPFQDMWQEDFIDASSSEKSALPVADVIEDHFKPLSVQAEPSNIRPDSIKAISNPREKAQIQSDDPFLNKSDHSGNDWDENWFTDSDSDNHSVDKQSNQQINNEENSANQQTNAAENHAKQPADDVWDEDWFQENAAVKTEKNSATTDDFFEDIDAAAQQKETLVQDPPENKQSGLEEVIIDAPPLDSEDKLKKSATLETLETVLEAKPVTPRVKKVKIPAPALKTHTASHNEQDESSAAMQQFIAGLQLDDHDMEQKVLENLDFKHVAELFRMSIQGTLDILHSRTEIKNEMRMDVTTIRPIENNPLKFSINADEALVRLLVPQKTSYLAPKQALEEAYNDIRAHQIAVISGIQATLNYMLRRFEPKKLTSRLQKKNPIAAIIPLRRQAKLWSLFEDLYETLQEEAEEDFNRLFGLEFSKAYEQQIDRLKETNRSTGKRTKNG